ncbi:hypothetical protein N7540_013140 [Penicillium herquei]|nr:hypothetical protein N7540_013140 [Penicillium herquei]
MNTWQATNATLFDAENGGVWAISPDHMNETGVVCAKTDKLIILAYYENKLPGETAIAVEKTADKFRELGY